MLTTTTEMYANALRDNYAVSGFIAYDMEMMQALVAAANAERSPILLQASAQAVRYAGADYLKAIADVAASHAEVPVSLHLDHGFDVEDCIAAIRHGFNSVMIDASRHPFEENIRQTRHVVEVAHDNGVVVEGELGSPEDDGENTDPGRVGEYVERTGVDSLAVVVGNSHGQAKRDRAPVIDVELLARIHGEVPHLPLVLHALTIVPETLRVRFIAAGGSTNDLHLVSEELFARIARTPGVCKLNNGYSLKMTMVTRMREHLREHPSDVDPRNVLGAARDGVEELVRGYLRLLGSAGRAE